MVIKANTRKEIPFKKGDLKGALPFDGGMGVSPANTKLGGRVGRQSVVEQPRRDLEYYARLPYTVIVEQWDDGKGPYWVARIAELPHCLIHAGTPEEAIKEIQEVKRDWIKSNLERRLPIPEPRPRQYSGQIRLRISPSLHKLLAYRAETEGMSLNQYMATALAMSVGIAKAPVPLRKARKKTLTGV